MDSAGDKLVAGLRDSSEWHISPTPPSSSSHLSDTSAQAQIPAVTPSRASRPASHFYLQPICRSSEA